MFALCTIHLKICVNQELGHSHRLRIRNELETLFSDITLSVVPAVVVADFNIHYDDHSNMQFLRKLQLDF